MYTAVVVSENTHMFAKDRICSTQCIYRSVVESNFFIFFYQLNLDRLLAKMWEAMGLVRIYTKPQGQQPDFTDPVVLSAVCYPDSNYIFFFCGQLIC